MLCKINIFLQVCSRGGSFAVAVGRDMAKAVAGSFIGFGATIRTH